MLTVLILTALPALTLAYTSYLLPKSQPFKVSAGKGRLHQRQQSCSANRPVGSQALLAQTPSLLQTSGYLQLTPPSKTVQFGEQITTELAIPALILIAGNFTLGFLNRQMTQSLPSEAVRGLAYPLVGYLWNQLLSPASSWKDAAFNTLPSMVDSGLIFAAKKPFWAGEWTNTIRALLMFYSAGHALGKEFHHEYQKWSRKDIQTFHLEGLPEGTTITLERNRPASELSDNRLTLFWATAEIHPYQQQSHPVNTALSVLLKKAKEINATALQLYPADNDGMLRLYALWLQDGTWSSPVPVVLPKIEARWWTSVVSDHYFSGEAFHHTNHQSHLADPLSAEILSIIAGQNPPLTRETLQVHHQRTDGLSVLSAKNHLNIWLRPAESGLLTDKLLSSHHSRIPDITLQAAKNFSHDIQLLDKHITKPFLPGWARLPLQLAKLLIFTDLQSRAWRKGFQLGDQAESRLTFQGVHKNWRGVEVPQHAERIEVTLSDGKTMTGNLIRSQRKDIQHTLAVVYHPTKDTSNRLANSGLLAPDEHNNATELGRFFDEQGYDVFFPEYRGYQNELRPHNKDLFLADAVNFFDHIAGEYEHISVIGYSIGTGAASHVARMRSNKIDRLVLLAPFQELRDVGRQMIGVRLPGWAMKFNMNNREALMDTTMPVHILHGSQDRLIPYSSSYQMFEYLRDNSSNKNIHYHLFPELGHNKILDNSNLMNRMINIFQDNLNTTGFPAALFQ